MKKLIIDDGLLITDMEITFKGKSLQLKRVLVDTGSGSTIISTDLDGIIGLDFLQQIRAIINIDKLTIEFN
ncbi:hypothetical protein [Robertmurraya andreesenii]|uniref:Peptidase A2 domain-containing protein n=1 Tax=Anoxybacillus andreesenii TaxID=1325932 RepID=A0ABT9VAJ5_9BACL|nr:hypothetical protein [Robertmurraya andreesenii]MDQ0157940.1 hypothetical protein [Robertmurraya andreesenii]